MSEVLLLGLRLDDKGSLSICSFVTVSAEHTRLNWLTAVWNFLGFHTQLRPTLRSSGLQDGQLAVLEKSEIQKTTTHRTGTCPV